MPIIHNAFEKSEHSGYLSGHLLIATPVLQESCFTRSVIYVCAHNEAGAMGVIVNAPVGSIRMRDVFEQLEIKADAASRDLPVHFGGPVESNRGFVLHSDDYACDGPLIQRDGMAVTGSVEVLRDLAAGGGPKQGILLLGYAGWAAGQLESEIESGSWIVAPAASHLVLTADNDTKWALAAASLGVDIGHYSTVVGHA